MCPSIFLPTIDISTMMMYLTVESLCWRVGANDFLQGLEVTSCRKAKEGV